MTDLGGLFAEVLTDISGAKLPTIPAKTEVCGKAQDIENACTSRTSHNSRNENQSNGLGSDEHVENQYFSDPVSSRATSSYEKSAGSAGSAGSGVKTPAGSTTSFFPQKIEEVGSAGRDGADPSRPPLDLNRAAPQRSDWWTGPAMTEVDGLQASPLPILPAAVRAGVERELRDLARFELTETEALHRAIAITAAKIRNSPALIRTQTNEGLCFICGAPNDDEQPVVSVMQPKGGRALAMHGDCHPEHIRRVSAEVDRIMAAAGYGADKGTAL